MPREPRFNQDLYADINGFSLHAAVRCGADEHAMVVPQGPDEGAEAAQPAACEANCGHHRPAHMRWAMPLMRIFSCDITWVQVSLH